MAKAKTFPTLSSKVDPASEDVPVGGYVCSPEQVTFDEKKQVTKLAVRNTGDRPVQVGSHFHFFEVNRALEFDRAATDADHAIEEQERICTGVGLATIEPSRASGGGSKTTAPLLGRGPISSSDDIDLPEPLRSFCLGCGLAEGRVVIAWYRQFVPALGMTLFCDTPCDSNPAGPIQEAVRHGFLQSLESVRSTGSTIANR